MENKKVDISDNYYFERIKGYVSELRIDARWKIRQVETDKPSGSLRIVSHPDLPPGHLRAYFTYIKSIKSKTQQEKLQTIEDYQMDVSELEVYSVDDHIKTNTEEFTGTYNELQDLFGVKIINND